MSGINHRTADQLEHNQIGARDVFIVNRRTAGPPQGPGIVRRHSVPLSGPAQDRGQGNAHGFPGNRKQEEGRKHPTQNEGA